MRGTKTFELGVQVDEFAELEEGDRDLLDDRACDLDRVGGSGPELEFGDDRAEFGEAVGGAVLLVLRHLSYVPFVSSFQHSHARFAACLRGGIRRSSAL